METIKMNRYSKKMSQKIGQAPGTVVYLGEKREEKPIIEIIEFDETNFQGKIVSDVTECFSYLDSPSPTWIRVTGIHDVNIIKKLGEHFGLHPLTLEDIVNTIHRPSMDETENYLFVSMKMLHSDSNSERIISEQVSIILGSNFVISFEETKSDVFDPVKERIKKAMPRTRFLSVDYLAYSLMDAVVDYYYLVLENLGERIESIEEKIISKPVSENIETIHQIKRQLIFVRKSVWPLREVIGGLERMDTPLIHDSMRMFLRDLYEHAVQVIDTVETYRDTVSGLLDIYLSSMSNRLNEVMKILTIIATIFMPLSFLAGVFGMNFNTSVSPFNMPELGLRYGYPLFWLLVLIIGGGLLWFFRRKRWL
jgi:magnesium transporter